VRRRTLTVSIATIKTRRTEGRGLVPEMGIARIAKIKIVIGTETEIVIVIGVAVTGAAVVIATEGAGTDETVADLEIVAVPEIVAVETGIVIPREGHGTRNGILLLQLTNRTNPKIRMGM
jgi:hypothetical protein